MQGCILAHSSFGRPILAAIILHCAFPDLGAHNAMRVHFWTEGDFFNLRLKVDPKIECCFLHEAQYANDIGL